MINIVIAVDQKEDRAQILHLDEVSGSLEERLYRTSSYADLEELQRILLKANTISNCDVEESADNLRFVYEDINSTNFIGIDDGIYYSSYSVLDLFRYLLTNQAKILIDVGQEYAVDLNTLSTNNSNLHVQISSLIKDGDTGGKRWHTTTLVGEVEDYERVNISHITFLLPINKLEDYEDYLIDEGFYILKENDVNKKYRKVKVYKTLPFTDMKPIVHVVPEITGMLQFMIDLYRLTLPIMSKNIFLDNNTINKYVSEPKDHDVRNTVSVRGRTINKSIIDKYWNEFNRMTEPWASDSELFKSDALFRHYFKILVGFMSQHGSEQYKYYYRAKISNALIQIAQLEARINLLIYYRDYLHELVMHHQLSTSITSYTIKVEAEGTKWLSRY